MATTTAELVCEERYRRLALDNRSGQLELHHGRLREKPAMTGRHGNIIDHLAEVLHVQLRRARFRLRTGHARLRLSGDTYFIPDLAIIPAALAREVMVDDALLDAYADPLPLVVEVWSPSTGKYDVAEKLARYQERGDVEIWYIQPRKRELTDWRRQHDGEYPMTVFRQGKVQIESADGAVVDLEELFADD